MSYAIEKWIPKPKEIVRVIILGPIVMFFGPNCNSNSILGDRFRNSGGTDSIDCRIFEQRHMVVFVADDLGFWGPGFRTSWQSSVRPKTLLRCLDKSSREGVVRPHRAPVAQNGILGPENPKCVTSRSVTWRCLKFSASAPVVSQNPSPMGPEFSYTTGAGNGVKVSVASFPSSSGAAKIKERKMPQI